MTKWPQWRMTAKGLDSESDVGRYLMGVARRVEEMGHDPETALRSYGIELRNRIMRAEKAIEPRTLSELSPEEMRLVWEQAAT